MIYDLDLDRASYASDSNFRSAFNYFFSSLCFLGLLCGNVAGAQQRLNDLTLFAGPTSSLSRIDVRNYWPQPKTGEVLINEFAFFNGATGRYQTYSAQRYERAGNQFYLVDYLIKADGSTQWLDTWVYTVSNAGVLEVMDTDPNSIMDQREAPLDHGLYLTKGYGLPPHFSAAVIKTTSSMNFTYMNYYSIWLQDIKASLSLPGGTFKDVAMQAEEQSVCNLTLGDCYNSSKYQIGRYKFFYAPGKGIVAQVYYDSKWKQQGEALVLSKSCTGGLKQYKCP